MVFVVSFEHFMTFRRTVWLRHCRRSMIHERSFAAEVLRTNIRGRRLKETTHLRHFFKNIVNNFHNTFFHSLFRNTYYFPN